MANQAPGQPNTEGTPAAAPAPDHITGTAPEEIAKTAFAGPPPVASVALMNELDKLPPIPAITGLRGNAASGYYATAPVEELASALRKLEFGGNEEAQRTARALADRVAAGQYGGRLK